MEPPRANFRCARLCALEEGKPGVYSRTRHPWSRRPEPLAVAAALLRGLRRATFSAADIEIIAREAACVALGHVRSFSFKLDEDSFGNGYGIAGELFRDSPELPALHRYLGALASSAEPDAMHLVRTFRRAVRTQAHNHLLGWLSSKYHDEHSCRRQVREAAKDLHIAMENRRLLFVPERRTGEPIPSWDHLVALSRACKPSATVPDLVLATRTILGERRDVAGWLEIYDLVSDYLNFFARLKSQAGWGIAPDDSSRRVALAEYRAIGMERYEEIRAHCLREWEGPPEAARLDIEAFRDLIDVFFETGRYEERWIHWAKRFPDKIHSNKEFHDSRHRRRADAMWRELRRAFGERLGRDLGYDPRPDGEEP